ncbi:MAG: glycogen-binding domain-containing protein [Leptospirales bacterium]|nr:glycogen-binding domain-containing protein [Leptospirales bacterium]
MKFFKIAGTILLSITVLSSMPYNETMTNHYNLMHLKDARAPEKIKLFITDNIGEEKSSVVDGLLFTYKNRKADSVSISGNFSSWKMVKMTRGKDGVWFYFLSNSDFSGKVEYKFNVDGLWTEDPSNYLKTDDRMGSYISLSENDKPTEGPFVTYKIISKNKVLFQTYNPKARIISLVGDFNGWNPENDLMKRGHDGIWRLEKRLNAGVHRYKFIIDGKWTPDFFNSESASDNTGDLCSIVKIK